MYSFVCGQILQFLFNVALLIVNIFVLISLGNILINILKERFYNDN